MSEKPQIVLVEPRLHIDKSNIAILAAEYGYKACERGESLQEAMSGALRLLALLPHSGD